MEQRIHSRLCDRPRSSLPAEPHTLPLWWLLGSWLKRSGPGRERGGPWDVNKLMNHFKRGLLSTSHVAVVIVVHRKAQLLFCLLERLTQAGCSSVVGALVSHMQGPGHLGITG